MGKSESISRTSVQGAFSRSRKYAGTKNHQHGKAVQPSKVHNAVISETVNNNKKVNNNLRIASLNINRVLFNKEERLIHTIEEHDLDIFGVSEVDIKDFDETKPFSLEGFNTFFLLQRPRTNTKRILCFTKSNIEVKLREDLMSSLLSNIWL